MAQQLFPAFQVIIVPGLHDSSAGHWQSRWQRAHPEFCRVRQDDWADPDLARWSARLDQVRASDPRPALLVVHSFARNARGVAGVFLVAPADKFGVAGRLPAASPVRAC
jgi:predicted alpha/beta hydrolase family esterase